MLFAIVVCLVGVSEYGHYTAQAQESLLNTGATNTAVFMDHVYYRWPQSIYRPLYRLLYRSTVSRLSADSPRTVVYLSANSRSTVGRLTTDSLPLCRSTIGRYVAINCRPTIGQVSDKCRPSIGLVSAKCWPSVGQVSV